MEFKFIELARKKKKRILSKRVRRRWRREDWCAIIGHPTAFIQPKKKTTWNPVFSFFFFGEILLSPRIHERQSERNFNGEKRQSKSSKNAGETPRVREEEADPESFGLKMEKWWRRRRTPRRRGRDFIRRNETKRNRTKLGETKRNEMKRSLRFSPRELLCLRVLPLSCSQTLATIFLLLPYIYLFIFQKGLFFFFFFFWVNKRFFCVCYYGIEFVI